MIMFISGVLFGTIIGAAIMAMMTGRKGNDDGEMSNVQGRGDQTQPERYRFLQVRRDQTNSDVQLPL